MTSDFIPALIPPTDFSGLPRWLVFYRYRLLVDSGEEAVSFPAFSAPEELGLQVLEKIYLGTLSGSPCFAAAVAEPETLPPTWTFMDLRWLHGRIAQERLYLAFRAIHLLDWSRKTKFCRQCGNKLEDHKTERAKICPACGHQSFPRISPAVIVLVEKGDQCLLARSPRFQEGFYSVLAGFVEPGETLEDTVRREIREETGIEVRNIRYFGSQPWPFPDSLMIGFTCLYDSGEIKIDGTEILEAGWFRFDGLPKVPGKISIAGELIDWFVRKHQPPQ
jgi:NAD+ diphosphatase